MQQLAADTSPDGRDPTPVAEARGLTKRFGSAVALDGLDLHVPHGTSLGLVGPPGAGKTTTIRLLAGLARPTAGTARINGLDTAGRDDLAVRRRIGLVTHAAGLYGWMTGRELLTFAAVLAGVPEAELTDRVDSVAARVGVADALPRRVEAVGLPTQRRLGIGQAIVSEPELLLLDEPASGLDGPDREGVVAVVADLRASLTMVVATSSLAVAARTCDRVVVLDRGRRVIESTIADLERQFAPAVFVIDLAAPPDQAATGLAVAGVVARLGAERWVTAVSESGGAIRVAVGDPDRATRELLPAVVSTGLRVNGFRREPASLADILGGRSEGAGR